MTTAETDEPAANGDRHPEAWKRTIEDMRAMGEMRREQDGWDVVEIEPARTVPVGDDTDRVEEFGFVHVVDDEETAEEFANAFGRCSFPRYRVYRNTVEDSVFFVTEAMDPAQETAVLIGGRYDVGAANDMVAAATRRDEVYTHVEGPEGDLLGTIQHDSCDKFVTDAAREAVDRTQLSGGTDAEATPSEDVEPAESTTEDARGGLEQRDPVSEDSGGRPE